MSIGIRARACALVCLSMFATTVLAATPPPSPVKELGGDRFQVGGITVDKAAGTFSVAGTVLALASADSPVEFIALTKGSIRSYEGILELDTSAVDFNLACILIGLDAAGSTRPAYHFDPKPVQGPRVDVTVSFDRDGTPRTVPIAALVKGSGVGADATHEWVYNGSFFMPNGGYAADELGVLISVVHDPESIIHHRAGLGLGQYGSVVGNADAVPPPGGRVTLTVRRVQAR